MEINMTNRHLHAAKQAKNDEFYTQISDIEEELRHYTKQFKDKVVYCNCDDPCWSNFWRYFYRSFSYLGLKKLISTHYEMDGSASYAAVYEGGHDNAENCDEGVTKVPLKGDGDFRSDECIGYLKESDIVVTNPPFSLAREYIKQLIDNNKKFLVIGNPTWINYKEVFPLMMHRKIWFGASHPKYFDTPNGDTQAVVTRWFTNLPVQKSTETQKSTDTMVLRKSFNQKEYPAYDDYAAFECGKVANIPTDTEITITIDKDDLQGYKDTYGDDLTVISTDDKTVDVKIDRPIIGVPITLFDKYNPNATIPSFTITIIKHNLAQEFDIVGEAHDGSDSNFDLCKPSVNGKKKYPRVLIRAKKGVKF